MRKNKNLGEKASDGSEIRRDPREIWSIKFAEALAEFVEFNSRRNKLVEQPLSPALFANLLNPPYRQKISEKIKAGMQEAKSRGVKLGGARNRPKYSRARIFQLARRGATQQRIAKLLGCSQALVSKVLKKEKAKGSKKK